MLSLQSSKKLEADIKSAVLNYLKDKGNLSSSSIVMNELTLNKFSRRVDLAILEKGKTFAFEIKSASDSLYRLEGQIEEYLNYFDKVTVVAATKHTEKVLSIVPKNVGVWELRDDKIAIIQKGKQTPIKSLPRLMDLLKANELCKLSNMLNLHSASCSRKNLEATLLEMAQFNNAIRDFCLQCIEKRYSETSRKFWMHVENGQISPQDIQILSRTHIQREQESIRKAAQNRFWGSFKEGPDLYMEDASISFGSAPRNIRELIAA